MLSRTSSKKALRQRGHVEIPMARHFRGEDEEILRETQGKPPKVKPVEKLGAFLYRLGEFETVVIGVEETRLFNKENVLAVRYRLPKAYSYTPESAEIRIRDNHEQRIETLGLAELGHFKQQALWKTKSTSAEGKTIVKYVDPNWNNSLRQIRELSNDVMGLKEQRRRIMMALVDRDPMKIGPTAISKIAEVIMAM